MLDPQVTLTLMGLAIIAITVGLLIWGKVSPVVAMVVVPVIGAILLGFGFEDLQAFFDSGLKSVISVVVMFIFAIIFFGILADAGLFDPLIRFLITMTRGRAILVSVGTVLIGAIAHLDGAGATTFLLTIPALLPLYKALNMSRYLLLLLVSLSASIMNMVPWGGPLARAAAVTGIDPGELYQPLIAVQGVGLALLVALAILLGMREVRRIRRAGLMVPAGSVDVPGIAARFEERQRADRAPIAACINHGRLVYAANILLVIVLLVVMLGAWLSPALAFLIGVAIALPLNFRSATMQMQRMAHYAPSAIMMAAVILAAAVFLGVLRESQMLDAIAQSLLTVMPASLGRHLHIVVGVLGVPLDMLTSTDAYYFSILPLVEATAAQFGVSSAATAHALMIGNIIGTFVSPFAPAMWLALGLAEANVGKHVKYSFLIMWGFSIVLLFASVLIGVVPF